MSNVHQLSRRQPASPLPPARPRHVFPSTVWATPAWSCGFLMSSHLHLVPVPHFTWKAP